MTRGAAGGILVSMPRGTAGNGAEYDPAFEARAGEIAKAMMDALPREGPHGCALLLRRAVALLESSLKVDETARGLTRVRRVR